MLAAVEVARGPGFAISTVTCRDDHTGWSAPSDPGGHDVVLARRGRFRRRADGRSADIDPTIAYVGLPGQEAQFAHPDGGDVCTWIRLEPGLWRDLAGDAAAPAFYVDAPVDLTHRRLLAVAAHDAEETTEHLLDLVTAALAQTGDGPTPADVPPGAIDRVVVDAARQAILAGHPASHTLTALATLIGTSPFRLSRAFSRMMGVSLTRYRNRVRLGRALDRLERGEDDLAALAADLGFADQSHLCRTARQLLGRTPGTLRRLLGG